MFLAISFAAHRIPVVVHCQWEQVEGVTKNCSLLLFAAQDALERSLATENMEGSRELSLLVGTLPKTSRYETVCVRGDVASTLSNFVADLHHGHASIDSTNVSDLSGFWAPPANRPPGDGILVWIDPVAKCHVAIVHSKQQARSTIRSLSDWMGDVRRRRLLEQIKTWNMPESTKEEVQYIENDAAEVIHWASLLAKARGAMRRQQT